MANDNQSWVLVVVAVAGLLVVGVAVKQCGSSPEEAALRQEADRAVAVAARSERSGWSVQEGGEMAGSDAGGVTKSGSSAGRAGSRRGAGESGAMGAGSSAGGSAQTVRDQLKRRSQQAVAAASGAPSIKVDSAVPVGVGSERSDPFKEARERLASRTDSAAPLVAAQPAALLNDPNNPDQSQEPSETPALSVLGKESEARDDTTLVGANTAAYQAGEGHVFDSDSQVKIPNAGNINGDAGTIAFELKSQWEGNDDSDAAFFDIRTPNEWNNRMELVKNGPYLRFIMFDSQGVENGIGFQMKDWDPSVPHPIAVSWGADENGQKVMSLYVDGNMVGQRTYENDFSVPNNQPLVIGNNAGGGLGAKATLNGFQVYNNPLGPGRIQGLSFGRR